MKDLDVVYKKFFFLLNDYVKGLKFCDVTKDEITSIVRMSKQIYEVFDEAGFLFLNVITRIFDLDRIYYIKNKDKLAIFDADLRRLIKRAIPESKNKDSDIIEFFKSSQHITIPYLTEIVQEISDIYCKTGKYSSVLQVILNTSRIEEIINIIDIDVVKWIPIITNTFNNDISFFIVIYNKLKDKRLLSLVPAFCEFCTDSENQIENFLAIIKDNLCENLYFDSLCNGLYKLITSHKSNLSNTIIMKNQIPKDISLRILDSVKNPDIHYSILKNYSHDSSVVNNLLFELFSESIFDYKEFENFVLQYPESKPFVFCDIQISTIVDCFRFFKFIIPSIQPNVNLTSKILNMCQSQDILIQKKSYEMLFYLKKYNKIGVCICTSIFSVETERSFKNPSFKNRFLFLYECYKMPCDCNFITKSKFIESFFKNMYTGNLKSKIVCQDIVNEIIVNEPKIIDTALPSILDSIINGSIDERNNSIFAFTFLLENHSTLIKDETICNVTEKILDMGKQISPMVFTKYIKICLRNRWTVNFEKVIEVLEFYVLKNKKRYFKDIRSFLLFIKEDGIKLSKKLMGFLKRNYVKSREVLQITKNNDVIIREEKI